MWASPPTSDFPQSQTPTRQGSGPHWPPQIPGASHPGSWPPLHCGDPKTSQRRLPPVPHCTLRPPTRVREGTPGDWRLQASPTCRSRAPGTTGAGRSQAARATTPGPRLSHMAGRGWGPKYRDSRIPGGGDGMCQLSQGCGVSGLFRSIFFLHILKQKRTKKTLRSPHPGGKRGAHRSVRKRF